MSSTPDLALELLAPAKNADFGMEAIRHGADAVYIGAPAFGARAAVGNSTEEIKRLVDFAHLYGVRVNVALNTILTDDELPHARDIISEMYDMGVDAIIVQDYGLLTDTLPPIPLHASTQMDNMSVERIRFLSSQGFEQVVVPREFAPPKIAAIHKGVPDIRLECFVHGALCVSYSGRCYAATAFHGRSANRGSCSQVCRLPYDLIDGKGEILQSNKHLLSIKDLNRSQHLSDLILAGVRSFKIEGRLKDLSYVKSVTAHYHNLLNDFIDKHPEFYRRSHGEVTLDFIPDINRVFNRGYTAFTHNGRGKDDLAAFDTPKSMGERVGTVSRISGDRLIVALDTGKVIANGDGLAYHLPEGGTAGIRVNVADQGHLQLNGTAPSLMKGAVLFRNSDIAFNREMGRNTATRHIPIVFSLDKVDEGIRLTARAYEDIEVSISESVVLEKATSGNTDASIRSVLTKCGDTVYTPREIETDEALAEMFIPRGILTRMRRDLLLQLDTALQGHAKQQRPLRPCPNHEVPYPEAEVDYTANVYNQSAYDFYQRHGSNVTAPAYETSQPQDAPVMYTRHCIRFSLGQCPHLQAYKGTFAEPWVLSSRTGNVHMRIHFDCKQCMMMLYPL